jgi:2-polyprenyl-3-methyl-5-hydroxy-6-metoxy-1,4-benzoquinol methylase
MLSTSAYYHENAQQFFERYRALSTPDVLGAAVLAIPPCPSLVLDLGSGSGRDSEWLADLGHIVVSVEPATALRDLARAKGQDRRIVHFDAKLPQLDGLEMFVGGFDFVLCSAVWMHLDASQRPLAADRLYEIVKPGGAAVVTFKVAPEDRQRIMFEIDPNDVAEDFRRAGFDIAMNENEDLMGRDGTRWFTCVLNKDAAAVVDPARVTMRYLEVAE